ncbi:MAG: glycosyltransferase family 4 protein [Nitrospiraceae bacterium]
MRIALDASPLVRNRAGIGTYTSQLLKALVRVAPEHEYYLYVPYPLPEGDRAVFDAYPFVKIVRCPPLLMGLRAQWDRVDLFHGLNYKLRGWGRYGGVVTIYDLALDRFPQFSRKMFGQGRSFLRTRRTARRASRVVTISGHSAADIMELYDVPRERIAIVSPGVGSEFYPVANPALRAAVRARYGIRRGAFVLSGGGTDPRKNIVRLIEAFGLVRGLRETMNLVVVGGMERRAEPLHAAVRRAGLAESVIFPGHVPSEDLRVLYTTCSVFVFPSLYEGFGMPVLEAMACGAPVVSSNAASLPEVVGDAALLVEPTDVQALAGAVARVVEDLSLCEELRRRGAIRAKAYSWERSARDLLEVYRELCVGEAA